MNCIISGVTCFIGRPIVDLLLRYGDYVGVWIRRPGKETRTAVASFSWDPLHGEPPAESLNTMDAVIHLAGEPVAQRWNVLKSNERIRDSRVLGTRSLVDQAGAGTAQAESAGVRIRRRLLRRSWR